jgi:hypothetical protein
VLIGAGVWAYGLGDPIRASTKSDRHVHVSWRTQAVPDGEATRKALADDPYMKGGFVLLEVKP